MQRADVRPLAFTWERACLSVIAGNLNELA